ncbi:MAG TPA: hypothetical protein VMU17_01795 [Elusimicrobiota bacterium]|nr:hypothetical protein [Elusimicrobiota bacterium]
MPTTARVPVFEVISARPLSPVARAMLWNERSVPSPRMVLALAVQGSIALHLWLLSLV